MSSTAAPVRRRPPLQQSSVKPLEPWAAELAPAAVQIASEAHTEALARLAQFRHEQREAEAAQETAAAADQQAAAQAVERGKPVPAATYPAALEARSRAARAVEAAEELARASQHTFITALNENRDDFAASVLAVHVALRDEGTSLLEGLERILVRLRDLRLLAAELNHLSPPGSRAQLFQASSSRRYRDPLAGSQRELLDGLRAALEAESGGRTP